MNPMKPILFNTEMVRAIQDGRKTFTRRLVKPQPVKDGRLWRLDGAAWTDNLDSVIPVPCHSLYNKAPFHPGDILYVRETWRVQSAHRFEADAKIEFRAGGQMMKIQFDGRCSDGHERHSYDAFISKWGVSGKWHPSIHMPKEAARIFLRVTHVWIERLQAITDEEAIKEGVPDEWPMAEIYCPECRGEGLIGSLHPVSLGYMEIDCPHCEKAVSRFANLWNSTIKPADLATYGWEANPWVWVIEFERISKEEAMKC